MKTYLKIPCEMALFALRERKVSQVACYLTSQFLYSGKARTSDNPVQQIASTLNVCDTTIYSNFKWLLERNWYGKDSANGWYFFRGIDFIHEMEGWKYSRAALMTKNDLSTIKEFLVGAVLASIVKTRTGTGTDWQSRQSMQARHPVSLSFIQKVLNVSRKTAFTYRKIAKNAKYIQMQPNLIQIKGISASDISSLKQNKIDTVTLPMFGSTDSITVSPNQLRTRFGLVFAQQANYITPNIELRKR